MDQDKFALLDHTFSASPSATVLGLLRAREGDAPRDPLTYIGIAAWSDQPKTRRPDVAFATLPVTNSLPALPESKSEVETVAHDLQGEGTILLGSEATETRFKSLPLDRYSVVHLALHGYVNIEFPDRSALVFAPQENGKDDGLLEAREVRNLHLNAHLVTLSACNSGVGPVGEADVANLVNAFIEAGSESVVSSLWELDDRATERLMSAFYGNLSHSQNTAEALRQAQIVLVQAELPPYYWASFEVVGDPNTAI